MPSFSCHPDVLQAPEPYRQLARILNALHLIPSPQAQLDLIQSFRHIERPTIVAFLNAHGFNLCWEKAEVLSWFLHCDVLLRDGKGLELLLRAFGFRPGLNMNGTDFIPHILSSATGRIALFGTQDPYLSGAAQRVREAGRSVTCELDGFKDDAAYVDAAVSLRPDIIVLGMGMPKQERVALALRAALDYPCLIVCGGAILDFLAGRVSRAPACLRNFGLEWAYRLWLEPRRLAKRYVIGNCLFLARLLLLKSREFKSVRPVVAKRPGR